MCALRIEGGKTESEHLLVLQDLIWKRSSKKINTYDVVET